MVTTTTSLVGFNELYLIGMLKIFVDKKDTVSVLTAKITRAVGDRVTLVIPRDSKLGEANHLYLLKKHADEAEKTLVIESIDEHILELAEKHEMERVHPLFEGGGEKRQTFSDIRSHKAQKHTEKPIVEKEDDEVEEEEDVEEEVEQITEERPSRFARFRRRPKEQQEEYVYVEDDDSLNEDEEPPSRRTKYVLGGVAVFLVLAGLVLWGVGSAFGRVDVAVTLKKTPWQTTTTVSADKALSALRTGGTTVPAMLFTEKKNTAQIFKASGRKQTSQKATARVTIYNGYDSSPQILVATTRLATPDGKIFRLDSRVVVPGAKLANGKITPAGIETTVTADQPGKEYNIGPFEKMTIVGFKGTPKYDGFYAVMKEKASGGLIGEAPFPTDEDIAKAEEKTKETLRSALDINIRRRIPEEFKILKEASSLQILKMTVNKITDEQGNFGVLGEGQLSVIAFKEADVKTVLEGIMKGEQPELAFNSLNLSYEGTRTDFANGKMSFTVKADSVLISPFDADVVKGQIAGKGVDEARAYLGRLTGLESAKIGIWPPWLWSLPQNTSRITLTVE